MDLKTLLAPIADDMHGVDAVIRQRLSSEVALINEIGGYIVHAGGKRLRPALVLLAARALGSRDENAPRLLAAVVEFIHTATLLHDDVVDHSDLRRGRKTANAVWGNRRAVLEGDFFYARASSMIVEDGDLDILWIFAATIRSLAEGELLRLAGGLVPSVTEGLCFAVFGQRRDAAPEVMRTGSDRRLRGSFFGIGRRRFLPVDAAAPRFGRDGRMRCRSPG